MLFIVELSKMCLFLKIQKLWKKFSPKYLQIYVLTWNFTHVFLVIQSLKTSKHVHKVIYLTLLLLARAK